MFDIDLFRNGIADIIEGVTRLREIFSNSSSKKCAGYTRFAQSLLNIDMLRRMISVKP